MDHHILVDSDDAFIRATSILGTIELLFTYFGWVKFAGNRTF